MKQANIFDKPYFSRGKVLLPLLLLLSLFWACSKDLGNYDYDNANHIDIVTATDSFNVRQDDMLAINVDLSQTKQSTNLKHAWYIIQYSASTATPPEFLLDSTKNLNWKVGVVPGLYKLVNRVTDNNTGVSFYKYFKLKVLPAPWGGEGWLVLQDQSASKNGFDLSIILSRDGIQHGDVYSNLYQQANGRKLPLGTYGMSVVNYPSNLARQKVMFAYPGGATEVKAIDFSDSSYAENWFLTAPSSLDVQYDGNVDGGMYENLINNGQLYTRVVSPPSLANPPILFGAPVLGTWELAPFVMGYTNSTNNYVTVYDKKNRCFLTYNNETKVLVPNRPDVANSHYPAYSGAAANLLPGGTGFDLNDIKYNLLYAEPMQQTSGSRSTALYYGCFFRNDAKDSTFIIEVPVFLAYTNNIASGRFYLNPTKCPGINEAKLFASSNQLPMPGAFYYAHQNNIYTCNVSTVQGNSTASVGYAFPAGTIVKDIKVFKSGYSGPTTAPNTAFPASEGRVLVVATDETANGNGNNVYFINISASGVLSTTYADKYTGFDKIISIRFKKDPNL